MPYRRILLLCCGILLLNGARAGAQTERLCDPSFEDCRAPILDLIRNETVGIDVAFWFMEDARYSNLLETKFQAGIPVRVLVDTRANASTPLNADRISEMAAAGIPIRNRVAAGILHWKMMLFRGQGQVVFSAANFSPWAYTPVTPYENYTDEAVYFTDQISIVDSFKSKYDDSWVDTSNFTDYANISGSLTREYGPPLASLDPGLNFPPLQSYRSRAVAEYKQEPTAIDVIMYRITDAAHADAMIQAIQRGVPVRLLTEPKQYRDPTRYWHAYNVDRMYVAGVQVRHRAHDGLMHEKAVILRGLGEVIFGSSNWTSPSSDTQQEHNYFTKKPWFYQWFVDQFDRKWNNSAGFAETEPFTPLPPDAPSYVSPADGATGQPTSSMRLKWYAGLWAHLYDIYFGTSPSPPLFAANVALGPSRSSTDYKTYTLPTLQPGTTYYWRVVSKTMAYQEASGAVRRFTTTGTPASGSLPSGWSSTDVGSTGAAGSSSYAAPTFTVAGAGADIWGTSDAFQFAFEPLTGDGTITARVATIQNVAAWTKAGVMLRTSLSSSSAHAFALVSAGKGVAFQRRRSDGASSLNTAGSTSTAPRWVRLTRAGNTITAYESTDGSNWTLIGSDTFSMPQTVYAGLAVSSHVSGVTATATFDGVSVGASAPPPPPPLPSGWSDSDVGTVPIAGSAGYANGTYTVTGSGADIWGTADAFHFAYMQVTGDATIVARVATVENANAWTKAGVMIRETLAPGSTHALALVSAGKGVAFQRRPVTNGTSLHTAGSASVAPRWVKLVRSGGTFQAFESADGANWVSIGTQTISMSATVYVGLAVTSHTTSSDATATFDNVVVQ